MPSEKTKQSTEALIISSFSFRNQMCIRDSPSVACSTAEALAWDTAFKNLNDPSGRAVKGVHEEAY